MHFCMGVPSAKFLKRQAAACANLAAQTGDEESRQRCLRLEQTYLQLAKAEEQVVVQAGSAPGPGTDPQTSSAV
jgi:hypothetical protein